MFSNKIIEEAKKESIELLKKISTEKGFVASSVDVDNYKRVFSRDGVISGLSALFLEDGGLNNTFKETLLTLHRNQDKTGRIPSNVSIDEKTVSYGTTVGRVDSTLWYIIGCLKYYLKTKDDIFLNEVIESIKKAIFYLECLELNGRHLLYVPPGGDWADEYINEGYVLFDQMLYFYTLKYYLKVLNEKNIEEYEYTIGQKNQIENKINHLSESIKANYFSVDIGQKKEYIYQEKLHEKIFSNYNKSVPIPSFSAFGANYYYDLFAISMIFQSDLITDIDKNKINKEISEEYTKKYNNKYELFPAFYPVINEKDSDWEKLNKNYLFRLKNKPYEYHNGGLWPVVYGFYLNSCPDFSKNKLVKLAKIMKRDEYSFPEFYHGKNLDAMGTSNLGFSAAGYLLAYQKFINKKSIFSDLYFNQN